MFGISMEWMFVLTYLGVLFWGGFWGALGAYLMIRAEKKKERENDK